MSRKDGSRALDRRLAAAIFGAAFLLRLAIFVAIAIRNPAYLTDYRLNANPDARHYVLLGVNVWRGHGFSREDAPPYRPDMLRTPAYPVLAGLLQTGFGAIWPLYLLQAALDGATAVAAAVLGARLAGRRSAIAAGLLVAFELTLVVLDFEAMTESLFVLVATCGVLVWADAADPDPAAATTWRRWAAAGAILGIAALVRPAGLYLPLPLAAAALFTRSTRRWAGPGALVAASVLVVLPWVARNAVVFGIPRVSTVDSVNLVYYVGAGAYQERYGIGRDAAQARIAKEHALPPIEQTFNAWTIDGDERQMDEARRRVAWTIVRRFPAQLAVASTKGVTKALLGHSTGSLAALLGVQWRPPQLTRLLQDGTQGAIAAARANPLLLLVVFAWQVIEAAALLVLAAAAALLSLRDSRRRTQVLLIGVPVLYHALTIAMVGIDAYARQRVGATPLLAALAGAGIVWLRDRAHVRADHRLA